MDQYFSKFRSPNELVRCTIYCLLIAMEQYIKSVDTINVLRVAYWFVKFVENFKFYELRTHAYLKKSYLIPNLENTKKLKY